MTSAPAPAPTLASNQWALKEWAIVTEALRQGTQTILLRKGGIAEGPGGFRIEHSEFWLYPTQFHQSDDHIRVEVAEQLPSVPVPPMGQIPLDVYAVVREVEYAESEEVVLRRVPEQILSEQTVRDRFHYRKPGLFVVTVEVFVRASPHWLEERPQYAGCHSWVPLETELDTEGLAPVSRSEAPPAEN